MSDQPKTIIIACGGTGGHLFPGIAVAEELQRRGHHPLLLISEKKVDAEASEKYGGLDFVSIPAIAKPPTFSPRMLPFMVRLWQTVKRCRVLLRERRADAVIGMGGFTSLPPVYAGHKLGLPTFVHDSNAIPGKSNVLTSRFCSKVLLGLAEAKGHFPKAECVVTGTPVRSEMRKLPARAEAGQSLGISPEKKTVLVFGGSQGAQHLNTLVAEAAATLGDEIQWLHVAGTADANRVEGLAVGGPGYKVYGFFSEMPTAYAAADLVICRSGASSLTELAFLGLPGILIPYPYAADDHQSANARAFAEGGGALMAQERDLDAAKLAAMVSGLLQDDQKRTTMAAAMRALAHDNAAGEIADVIEASIRR